MRRQDKMVELESQLAALEARLREPDHNIHNDSFREEAEPKGKRGLARQRLTKSFKLTTILSKNTLGSVPAQKSTKLAPRVFARWVPKP